ncbi:MAG: M4 family metallopeptidase [Saprospiraceae bacterium]|nr:M4 family metallopeptidase [Saprospiraceae bacterium]
MNRYIFFLFFAVAGAAAWAQSPKFKPQVHPGEPSVLHQPNAILRKPARALPLAEPVVLGYGNFTLNPLSARALPSLTSGYEILETDANGNPRKLRMEGLQARQRSGEAAYWAQRLQSVFDRDAVKGIEWIPCRDQEDHLGIRHFAYDLTFDGIPVHGAEYLLHVYPGGEVMAHGQYMMPFHALDAKIAPGAARDLATAALQQRGIRVSGPDALLPDLLTPVQEDPRLLYVQFPEVDSWKLVYEMLLYPSPVSRYLAWVDAQTGEILKLRTDQCKLHDGHANACSGEHTSHPELNPEGAETANALDLFDINRTINVWRDAGSLYMIDGSRPMFKSGSFTLDNPIGAIMTLDAQFTNPNNLKVSQIRTTNNSWSKTAVSAHYNGGKAYEYYLNTHGRNSIDGKGGTIVSIINLNDESGGGLDNAFWSGKAMFYGNGNKSFNALAKGLDVAGHEMTHGVVGSTAALVYENESGAMNESFADIFGVMIDREDWKMGEDVVKLSAFPSGALRNLSDPHNGAATGDYGRWQPRHVSEQYKGTNDNGGVHINSGIPNYAFYLFVQEMAKSSNEEQAKKIAEKVFYRALANYLTRSSVFIDLRAAVEQSCKDLHGNNSDVLNAAKKAFDQVGIAGSTDPGGNKYQNDLPVNPGQQFVVCTDDQNLGVYIIILQSGQIVQLSQRAIKSKPSVTDDGSEIYYVGNDSKLYAQFFDSNLGDYEEVLLDADPIYRNVAVSKDGNLLAVLYGQAENKIHIFSFPLQQWRTYELKNPTTGQGVLNSNVRFADFLDFEHAGEYLMYDCLSKIDRSSGGSYEFWDIGFLRVWNRKSNAFGDGYIDKLFSDLPENTSIGNPVFSKNSPYIIAFDYLEEGQSGSEFAVLGANIETGEIGEIASNRTITGYPNYSIDDKFVMYDGFDNTGALSIKFIGLNANKIQSSGNEQLFVSEARWGAFYATGTRKLVETDDQQAFSGITLFPVPFLSDLHVAIDSRRDQEVLLILTDFLGRECHSKSFGLQTGKNDLLLSVPELRPGMYYLVIKTPSGISSIPVSKH